MSSPDIQHERQLLLDLLAGGFDSAGWQGPTLMSSIRGVDHVLAQKTVRGRKSIWQQALHAAFWKQRVLNRVIGTQPFPRKGQNWPELPRPRTASAWKADQALLRAIHQRLMQAVRELDQARYSPRLRKMLYGISAHDVYHAGQIKLLRKMLEPAE